MAAPLTLNLSIDGDPFVEALTTATNTASEIIRRLVDLFEEPPCSCLVAVSDGDVGPTIRANEQRVVFNPSQGFLRLLAALQTFERELGACEELLRHDETSIGASNTSMVAEGPAAVASGGRPRGAA